MPNGEWAVGSVLVSVHGWAVGVRVPVLECCAMCPHGAASALYRYAALAAGEHVRAGTSPPWLGAGERLGGTGGCACSDRMLS